MEAIVKERQELIHVKVEFKMKEKEAMNKVKNQVQKYFQKNKKTILRQKGETRS